MLLFRRILSSFVALLVLAMPVLYAQEYKLEKVTIASRHSVRAPLEKNMASMSRLTKYSWYKFPVPGSNLTPRGAALEVIMGQYFKQHYDGIGFSPTVDSIYFAASPRQRTIATAECFASTFRPNETIVVEHKPVDSQDRAFIPLLNDEAPGFDAKAFSREAGREISKIIRATEQKRREAYSFLEYFLDCEPFDERVFVGLEFRTDLSEKPREPGMIGGLRNANIASDALILQYYEVEDLVDAAFGHNLTRAGWRELAGIKDNYGEILFTAPIVAVNVSHSILENLYKEISNPAHKFSFLCMHDTSIQSLLAALQVVPYSLPESTTIEAITPIGFKFVIEKYTRNGEEFARLRLIYQTSAQVREMSQLSAENPPASFNLRFKGLTPNEDGYYRWEDFMERIQFTLEAFYKTAKGEKPF